MKYLFLLLTSVMVLSSCKKDYTCSCKDVNGTPNDIPYRGHKKKAEKKCDYYNQVYANTGTTCTVVED
jgi:hypothetical protein